MSPKNIEIRYGYRDAANNKRHKAVVIANPAGYSAEELKAALLSRFPDIQCWPDVLHFQPELLDWPTAYFNNYDETEDDLNVHELHEVIPTDEPVTVMFDLDQLMDCVAAEGRM